MIIFERIIEFCFGTALFINALLFIPQIVKILQTKEVKDLSLITFAGFNIVQILAVLHGYLKHDYVVMLGFALSLLTCGIITIMIVFYKLKNYKLNRQK